ncbi:YncE family protein [Nocardia sp. NPDC052001]|uniref:YncE family protein n=1 Tax=Nocardia sp. NPDC052001 TaxID=3154853 RepID=UPI003429977A
MQQPFDQQVPHPGSGSPDQSARQQGSEALLECTYVADSRTALRLSRVIELDRWRSPRTWAIVAALPLVVMARHIFELVTGAGRSDTGPLGLLGAYIALLIPAAIIVALITGVRMMKKNPLVTAYSSVGLPMRVRYGRTAMEVSLTSGTATIDYTGIKGVTFFGGAALLHREFGSSLALPRELFPASALNLIRDGQVPGAHTIWGTSGSTHTASNLPLIAPDSGRPFPHPAGAPRHRRSDVKTSATSRRRRTVWIGLAVAWTIAIVIAVTLNVGGDGGNQRPGATDNAGRIESIPVPPGAYGYVAIDPAAKILYVANGHQSTTSPGSLSAIDMATSKIISTVEIAAFPQAIAVDPSGRSVYVVSAPNAGRSDGLLTIFDTVTNTVVTTIPTNKESVSVGVDPVTHIAYVNNSSDRGIDPKIGNYAASSLAVVPHGSRTVTATISTGTFSTDFTIVPEPGTAFVTSSDKSVKVVDLAKNALIGTISLSINPSKILFDPGVNRVFAVDKKGLIAIIDPIAMSVAGTIDGLGQEIDAVAVDSATHTLYIASFQDSRIRTIDTVTHAVTGSFRAPAPSSLAVDPDSHAVYSFGDSRISLIHR